MSASNPSNPVTFTATPSLVLLPSLYPNAVSYGETLGDVLKRINAFRSPSRQIVGAMCPTTGRHVSLTLPITGPLVVQEVMKDEYLQFGPTQYAAIQAAKKYR